MSLIIRSEEVDGQSTLALLESGHIDFLMTGWDILGMDERTLLKKIRADERLMYQSITQL